MMKPQVKPNDWVAIGDGFLKKNAVVCSVYKDQALIDLEGEIEVVYLDDRDRAINEGVFWKEDHWEFKRQGPSGGYADNYDRLRDCVRTLRNGK